LINVEYDPFEGGLGYRKLPTVSLSLDVNVANEIDPFLINDILPSSSDYMTVLKNLNNCVYFALHALARQKCLLASLDNTTIKVLIDNERLSNLSRNLHGFLREIHSHKIQLDSGDNGTLFEASSNFGGNNNSLNNVFYQQENDTKENFPSEREFGAFKKQRDAFYIILR
jgi:codanin-1